MPAPPRAGRPIFEPGAPAIGRWHRHAWRLGASLLAITAGLAATAEAQTVVGPGQTVTNTGSNTGGYSLTGSGGTLINQGTIFTSGTVGVAAEVEPFLASDLTSYRILGITLNNSGSILGHDSNAVEGIGVNGFAWTNSGTISTTSTTSGLPTVYLNNVNNLQLANDGTLQVAGALSGPRLLTLFKLTNSTASNSGMISSQAAEDFGSPILFLSGDSNNVTISNTGTISSRGLNDAILIGNDGTAAVTTTIDGTHVFTVNPAAMNVTVNNAGMIVTGGAGIAVGGTSSAVIINNSGTIATNANGGSAVVVQDAASNVTIANGGLIINSGATAAINVSSTGGGIAINNTGTITEASVGLVGLGLAIDHSAGTTPLAINNSGTIFGGILLSQPGDTVGISGGAINGAITTVNAGAGTVTFNVPGGFATGGDFGSVAAPLGAITVAGGALNLGHALIANAVTFGAGSTTTLTTTVNAVAAGGNLNLAGGTLNLGTNALVLGANAGVRTSTADGSTIGLTISPTQNGLINARAGNAAVDTSANTLIIRPNLTGGMFPRPGSEFAVIATSSGANVSNALTKMSVAPGPAAAVFSVGTATTPTDAFGNPLTVGKDIVLITTGSAGAAGNAETAPSNTQIDRSQVNAIASAISEHIGNVVANAIAGQNGTPAGGTAGGDEPGHNWTIWQDTSANILQNSAAGSSYRGTIWTGLAGIDQPVADNVIVGAVIGGEEESFNLTSSGGKRSGTGISFTPYAAYIINDWASVDFEASYAFLDNKVTVAEGQAVTNHYMTNRFFVAGNAAAYWNIDDFTLRAKFGFLWASNSGPRYNDANGVRAKPPATTLDQLKLGGEATYHYGQFEPFVDLTAAEDLEGTGTLNTVLATPTSAGSKFGLQYDAGVRYKLEGGSQFGLQVGGETLRGHQSSFMAGVFARIPL